MLHYSLITNSTCSIGFAEADLPKLDFAWAASKCRVVNSWALPALPPSLRAFEKLEAGERVPVECVFRVPSSLYVEKGFAGLVSPDQLQR